MRNPLGASTFIWESPFSDASLPLVAHARQLGFDVIEVCIEDPRLVTAAALKKTLDGEGMSVSVCGAFGPGRDVSHESKQRREQGLDYIKFCIEFAAQVGSPHVAGPMYSATGKTNPLTPAQRKRQWEWAVESLQLAAEYAAAVGIRLAIEPLNRFESDLVNTAEQGVSLCEDIGSPNVGLLLDTFHMNIEEKDIPAAVATAGARIFHFHASENDRGTPGSGHVPWHSVFEALRATRYGGQVVIESFTPDIVEIARAVSLWRSLGASGDTLAQEGNEFLRGLLTALPD